MIIAVTTENGQVFQHFGHTKTFTLYQVEGQKVQGKKLLETGAAGHSALSGLLAGQDVAVLICGGIGGGARNMLGAAGIQIVSGAQGSTDEAVAAYLAGNLQDSPEGACHGHDHEEGHHSCGEHSCGGSCH